MVSDPMDSQLDGSRAKDTTAAISNLDDSGEMVADPFLLGRRMVLSPASDAGSSSRPFYSNALVVVDEVDDEVAVRPAAKKPRAKRRGPDPPGSTMSTRKSLDFLTTCFGFPDGVELLVPRSDARADHPPEGYFTLYEAYFRSCFLWFPIPSVILDFLWRINLAVAQITPSGMRHLVGIMVRSYECGHEINVDHLLSLLEIRKTSSKDKLLYCFKGKPDLQVIGDFSNIDRFWSEKFFFVRINEASVGCDHLDMLRKRWGTRG